MFFRRLNKKQKKRIVNVFLVVLMVYCLLSISYKTWISYRLKEVARGLQRSQQSEDIVHVGGGTEARLKELPEDVKIKIKFGDAPSSFGDGKAGVCIIYSTQKDKLLGLRMRYDIVSDKFHILGYWTPR